MTVLKKQRRSFGQTEPFGGSGSCEGGGVTYKYQNGRRNDRKAKCKKTCFAIEEEKPRFPCLSQNFWGNRIPKCAEAIKMANQHITPPPTLAPPLLWRIGFASENRPIFLPAALPPIRTQELGGE